MPIASPLQDAVLSALKGQREGLSIPQLMERTGRTRNTINYVVAALFDKTKVYRPAARRYALIEYRNGA